MTHAEEFFEAVQTGDRAKVEAMLAVDPDLARAKTAGGLSAVLLAAYYQEPAIAALLTRTRDDLTLYEAAAVGRADRLAALLNGDPTQLDAYADDGFTPLGLASFFGQPEAVDVLLAHGADVNRPSRNPMRVAPLHSAVASKRLDIARRLLARGADANAVQADDFTPLHGAAQNGHAEMVELLLSHGADVNARQANGHTALSLARTANADDVVQLLRSAGALV